MASGRSADAAVCSSCHLRVGHCCRAATPYPRATPQWGRFGTKHLDQAARQKQRHDLVVHVGVAHPVRERVEATARSSPFASSQVNTCAVTRTAVLSAPRRSPRRIDLRRELLVHAVAIVHPHFDDVDLERRLLAHRGTRLFL